MWIVKCFTQCQVRTHSSDNDCSLLLPHDLRVIRALHFAHEQHTSFRLSPLTAHAFFRALEALNNGSSSRPRAYENNNSPQWRKLVLAPEENTRPIRVFVRYETARDRSRYRNWDFEVAQEELILPNDARALNLQLFGLRLFDKEYIGGPALEPIAAEGSMCESKLYVSIGRSLANLLMKSKLDSGTHRSRRAPRPGAAWCPRARPRAGSSRRAAGPLPGWAPPPPRATRPLTYFLRWQPCRRARSPPSLPSPPSSSAPSSRESVQCDSWSEFIVRCVVISGDYARISRNEIFIIRILLYSWNQWNVFVSLVLRMHLYVREYEYVRVRAQRPRLRN